MWQYAAFQAMPQASPLLGKCAGAVLGAAELMDDVHERSGVTRVRGRQNAMAEVEDVACAARGIQDCARTPLNFGDWSKKRTGIEIALQRDIRVDATTCFANWHSPIDR